MSGKNKRHGFHRALTTRSQPAPSMPPAESLLDAMVDGREYESIISLTAAVDVRAELMRAVAEVEAARKRPLLCYAANMINAQRGLDVGVSPRDDVPFAEMVTSVKSNSRDVDLIIATPGGRAEQVGAAVDALRRRFDNVTAIIPYNAFSAGTLWVLSANEIIMDERGNLGPIDPQVPTIEGRFVPLQALYALIEEIQSKVDAAKKSNAPLPLAWLEILRTIDKKELGWAITASKYSSKMATEWLVQHKFRDWSTHSSTGLPVSAAEKEARAQEIAALLCSHNHWLSHGHRIRREDVRGVLKLKIHDLEAEPEAHRAIRRLWGLLTWVFEKTTVGKVMLARDYLWLIQASGDAK